MTPGAKVTVPQTGSTLWIVQRLRGDGRADLIRRLTDYLGRVQYRGHIAGLGDITEVAPAPTFTPGFTITRDGVEHVVIEDRGDEVLFEVGAHFKELRGGNRLKLPSGNVTTISKADLRIEGLA
jgi:hypothetical protein